MILKMFKSRIRITFGAACIIECVFYSLCYPYGPPLSVCDNGLPIHVGNNSVTHPPQTTHCPFQININVTSYSPGDVIAVTVSSDVGEMFKGLFLQVREVPNFDGEKIKPHPVGSFSRRVANTKLSSCDLGLDTAFHKDPFYKMTAELNWKAPLLMRNDVIVRATILMDFSTYWTNVESKRIKLTRPDKLPAEDLEQPWVDEIIKTVKAGDKMTSRSLVKKRFERGFDGVMDPNEYIMVQYVNDLLPFEERHYGGNYRENEDDDLLAVVDSFSEKANDKAQLSGQNNKTSRKGTNMNNTVDKTNAGVTNLQKKTTGESDISSKNVTTSIRDSNIIFNRTDRFTQKSYVRLLKSVLNDDQNDAILLEQFMHTL